MKAALLGLLLATVAMAGCLGHREPAVFPHPERSYFVVVGTPAGEDALLLNWSRLEPDPILDQVADYMEQASMAASGRVDVKMSEADAKRINARMDQAWRTQYSSEWFPIMGIQNGNATYRFSLMTFG